MISARPGREPWSLYIWNRFYRTKPILGQKKRVRKTCVLHDEYCDNILSGLKIRRNIDVTKATKKNIKTHDVAKSVYKRDTMAIYHCHMFRHIFI